MVIFSDNAISEGLINTLELGNSIYIDKYEEGTIYGKSWIRYKSLVS